MKIYVPGKVIDVKKPKCISWLNLNVFFLLWFTSTVTAIQ